ENREKIEFANRLIQLTQSARADRDAQKLAIPDDFARPEGFLLRSRQFAIAASIGAILIGSGVWLAIKVERLNRKLAAGEQSRVELEDAERDLLQRLANAQERNDQLSSELDQIQRNREDALPKPTGSVLSMLLSPVASRGAGTSQLVKLSKDVTTLNIRLA